MKLSIQELRNKPHLLRLLSDEDLQQIGINPNSIRPLTTNTSAAASLLNPKALRELKGQEKAQHITFANWLNQNNHFFIHAPTYRKVHDLPPGWPDFTLFKTPSLPDLQVVCLFIEFKSPVSGFLSPQQLEFRKHFYVRVLFSALDAINTARDFFRTEP